MMTKFNVGDKVRILDDRKLELIGMVGVITTDDGSEYAPYQVTFDHGEQRWKYGKYLERITDKPKKSARITALETQVATLQAKVDALKDAETAKAAADRYPLTAQFNRLVDVKVDRILADIKRKASSTSPNKSGYHTIPDSAQRVIMKTPNEQRADVIKRAKAFVTDALNRNYVTDDTPKITCADKTVWFIGGGGVAVTDKAEFIVDSDKRTVVALIKEIRNNAVVHRGIAKCDPDDVFNADIGKAIALGRALGVDVAEFTKAVQPKEVVEGQTLQSNVFRESFYDVTCTSDDRAFVDGSVRYYLFSDYPRSYRIANDTNAVYE